jgi:hypothetical protein
MSSLINAKLRITCLLLLLLGLCSGCSPNAYLQSRDNIGRIGGYQGDFPTQIQQARQRNSETKYLCQMFQIAIESRRSEQGFLLGFGLFILIYCGGIATWIILNRQRYPTKPVVILVFVIINTATLAYDLQAWLPQGQIIAVAQLEHDQLCLSR